MVILAVTVLVYKGICMLIVYADIYMLSSTCVGFSPPADSYVIVILDAYRYIMMCMQCYLPTVSRCLYLVSRSRVYMFAQEPYEL